MNKKQLLSLMIGVALCGGFYVFKSKSSEEEEIRPGMMRSPKWDSGRYFIRAGESKKPEESEQEKVARRSRVAEYNRAVSVARVRTYRYDVISDNPAEISLQKGHLEVLGLGNTKITDIRSKQTGSNSALLTISYTKQGEQKVKEIKVSINSPQKIFYDIADEIGGSGGFGYVLQQMVRYFRDLPSYLRSNVTARNTVISG